MDRNPHTLRLRDTIVMPLMYSHRRRINTEEKTKVVAVAWGTEIIAFFAKLR